MPTRAARKKSAAASPRQHPIRIVPLHAHAPEATAPAPQLTYRNGPLLTNVEVFCIFWGQGWQSPAITSLSQQLLSFFDFILTSSLVDQLAEYSVPGKSIGYGKRIGSLNLISSEPGRSIDDSVIQQTLQSEITSGNLPTPTDNTLYFVFLPPGSEVTQGGTASSCKDFCGYHDATVRGIYYAVMPFPNCSGCQGGLESFSALTSASSHELCEAITDAIPGQGWYDDTNGEIGDICPWKTKQLGQYTIQLEWSNSASSCI
jgi:hypothetical protein